MKKKKRISLPCSPPGSPDSEGPGPGWRQSGGAGACTEVQRTPERAILQPRAIKLGHFRELPSASAKFVIFTKIRTKRCFQNAKTLPYDLFVATPPRRHNIALAPSAYASGALGGCKTVPIAADRSQSRTHQHPSKTPYPPFSPKTTKIHRQNRPLPIRQSTTRLHRGGAWRALSWSKDCFRCPRCKLASRCDRPLVLVILALGYAPDLIHCVWLLLEALPSGTASSCNSLFFFLLQWTWWTRSTG